VACDGAHVRTIEGFDDDAAMARLRQAFTEAHALQCGYCTPGMLIAARDLVRRKAGLSRAEIRTEMSGNLCRCTGYMGIVDAIERVMGETVSPSPRASSARGEGRGEGRRQAPTSAQAATPHPSPLPTEEWGEGIPTAPRPLLMLEALARQLEEDAAGRRVSKQEHVANESVPAAGLLVSS